MTGILALGLVVGGMLTARDTLVEVRPGDRLVLENFTGAVQVEAWDRSTMSLEAEGEGALTFRLQRSGNRLELRVQDRKDRNRAEELRIRVPSWMNLDLSGRDMEAVVQGVGGEVVLKNLDGEIVLRNLSGPVEAVSVEGEVRAEGLSGSARLRSGSDDVWVYGASGPLEVETVDGDLELTAIASPRISVRTTEGDIDFQGRLLATGEYSFRSHSGDIALYLDPPVDLSVSVLPYEGDFSSDFPVRARGFRTGEGFDFTIGNGGGRLVLEAFDGDIQLRRRELAPSADESRAGGLGAS